jgi:methyltransferase (TIGR00027 family)
MGASPVSNVSDTARWVAVYRAWESARSDALFHDPYAERLAGEQGLAIASLMPRQARSGWWMVARTRLIDDRVAAALARGCDRVLNLAAGLDARPYRLDLPKSLQWIEIDLPALLAEKDRLLDGAKPLCRLRRMPVDLTDPAARDAALDEALAGAARALVITEGLLVYLDAGQVTELAASLQARQAVATWVIDLASPSLVEMMGRTMGRALANAPMKFGPPEGVAFFERRGWAVQQVQSVFHAAAQWGRLPWFLKVFSLLPEPDPRRLGRARWSAVVELGRP